MTLDDGLLFAMYSVNFDSNCFAKLLVAAIIGLAIEIFNMVLDFEISCSIEQEYLRNWTITSPIANNLVLSRVIFDF